MCSTEMCLNISKQHWGKNFNIAPYLCLLLNASEHSIIISSEHLSRSETEVFVFDINSESYFQIFMISIRRKRRQYRPEFLCISTLRNKIHNCVMGQHCYVEIDYQAFGVGTSIACFDDRCHWLHFRNEKLYSEWPQCKRW